MSKNLVIAALVVVAGMAHADWVVQNYAVGDNEVAFNPVTNRCYGVSGSQYLGVLDCATMQHHIIDVQSNMEHLAINPVTNKIYVTHGSNDYVSEIDGGSEQASNILLDVSPTQIAVNPVTNKIYVTSAESLVIIDGSSHSVQKIHTPSLPNSIAINPVTNRIYIAHGCDTMTVVDGGTNTSAHLYIYPQPYGVRVNPATNRIYAFNLAAGCSTMAEVNGENNAVGEYYCGARPTALAINPVNNKVYVANYTKGITEIDCNTHTRVTVPTTDSGPIAIAVNPVNNKVYMVNYNAGSLVIMNGATHNVQYIEGMGVPIELAINPVTGMVALAGGAILDGSNFVPGWSANCQGAYATAVNPVTNTIYLSSGVYAGITEVDGASGGSNWIALPGAVSFGIATDPVLSKTYVACSPPDAVCILDAANDTAWIPAHAGTSKVAVNSGSGHAVAISRHSDTLTLIDGADNSHVDVVMDDSAPTDISVMPYSDKFYIGHAGSNWATELDFGTRTTRRLYVGDATVAVLAMQAGQRVYFGMQSGSVKFLDCNADTIGYITCGVQTTALAGNENNARVYVGNAGNNYINYIDYLGTTAQRIDLGMPASALAVDLVRNYVYALSPSYSGVIEIPGVEDSAYNLVSGPAGGTTVCVNPVTGYTYYTVPGANHLACYMRTDTGSGVASWLDPVPGHQTSQGQPYLTGSAVDRWSPNAPEIDLVEEQCYSTTDPWTQAGIFGGVGPDSVGFQWDWEIGTMNFGVNYLATVALESDVATTHVLGAGTPMAGSMNVYPLYLVGNFTGQAEKPANRQSVAPALTMSPNPCRGNIALDYRLASTNGAVIRVSDVLGRTVRTFRLESASGSEMHRLAWNLTDTHGRRLAPGVYFVRLFDHSASMNRKLIIE